MYRCVKYFNYCGIEGIPFIIRFKTPEQEQNGVSIAEY